MIDSPRLIPAEAPVLATLVHYVLPDGPERVHGECRPAVVVQDWGVRNETHLANLVVFRDGSNDAADGVFRHPTSLMEWKGSVPHSRTHEFGSWHRAHECPGLVMDFVPLVAEEVPHEPTV